MNLIDKEIRNILLENDEYLKSLRENNDYDMSERTDPEEAVEKDSTDVEDVSDKPADIAVIGDGDTPDTDSPTNKSESTVNMQLAQEMLSKMMGM